MGVDCGDYTEAPKYDEEPGGDLDDSKDQDIILTGLGLNEKPQGQPLQFEGSCNSRVIKVLVDGENTLSIVNRDVAMQRDWRALGK